MSFAHAVAVASRTAGTAPPPPTTTTKHPGAATAKAKPSAARSGSGFVTMLSGGSQRSRPSTAAQPPASAVSSRGSSATVAATSSKLLMPPAAARIAPVPMDEDDFLEDAAETTANPLPTPALAAAPARSSTSAGTAIAVDLTDSPVKPPPPPVAAPRPGRAQRSLTLQPPPPASAGASAAASAAASSSATVPPVPAVPPPGSSRSGVTLQCMLCGISLAMMPLDDRQKHINQCLDQLTQPAQQQKLPPPAKPVVPPLPPVAAASPSPLAGQSMATAMTPQKRKLDSIGPPARASTASPSPAAASPSTAVVAGAPTSSASSRDPDICVIEDDDDAEMVPATTPSAVPSPVSGVRRSITDFFGARSSGAKSSSSRGSPAAPASASVVPPLKRARTVPTSTGDAAVSASATPDPDACAPPAVASAAASTAEAVQAAAAAAAATFAAEKTADAWKFLLTGRKSGTLATGGGGGGGGGGARGGKGKGGAKKGEPEVDAEGLPLTSMPQGNIAGQSTSRYGGTKGGGLPAHKRLPGTSVLTDAFMFTRTIQAMRWPAEHPPLFFLSHFHADHYAGLSRSWSTGSIFCSDITARLVRNAFGDGPHLVPLPMHTRLEIGQVRVTLIDAHHCPGAVIFVFETQPFAPAVGVNFDFLPPELAARRRAEEAELVAKRAQEPAAADEDPAEVEQRRRAHLPHGKVYVHGGDMRFHASMRDLFLPHAVPVPAPTWSKALAAAPSPYLPAGYTPLAYPSLPFRPALSHLRELSISCVYLDTTYCNPRYQFPPQAVSVAHALAIVGECLAKEKRAGVSSLVDTSSSSKAVRSKLDFFKPLGAKASGGPVVPAPAGAAAASPAPVAPAAVEGVAAFLTQVPSSTSASASLSSSADEPFADEAAADAGLLGGSELAEELHEIPADEGEIDTGTDGSEQQSHAAAGGAADVDADDEGDEELEDLMMRDFDRRDEEDEEQMQAEHEGDMPALEGGSDLNGGGFFPESAAAAAGGSAAAASSSSVGSALSSLLSSASASVTSSLSSLRASLSVSSSFLSGYRRAALSRTLFLVGSYSIGKEKVFLEIARQFGLKIFVPPYRIKTIKMLDLFEEQEIGAAEGAPELKPGEAGAADGAAAAASSSGSASSTPSSSPLKAKVSTSFSSPSAPSSSSIHREWVRWRVEDVLTTCVGAARLHVIPLSYVNHKSIGLHIDPAQNAHMPSSVIEQFHRVVAFRPTGWVGNKPTHSERAHTVTLLPPTKRVPADSAEAKAAAQSKVPAIAAAATASKGGKKGGKSGAGGKAMVSVPCGPVRKHTLSVSVHGVPYSEHSTYPELEQFVATLAQCGLQTIVPTVNVASVREQVNKHWGHLLNRTQSASAPAAAAEKLGATPRQTT